MCSSLYSTLFGPSAQGQIPTLIMATSHSTSGPLSRGYTVSRYLRIGARMTVFARQRKGCFPGQILSPKQVIDVTNGKPAEAPPPVFLEGLTSQEVGRTSACSKLSLTSYARRGPRNKWEQTRLNWPTPRIPIVPLYCCRHQVIYDFTLAITQPSKQVSLFGPTCTCANTTALLLRPIPDIFVTAQTALYRLYHCRIASYHCTFCVSLHSILCPGRALHRSGGRGRKAGRAGLASRLMAKSVRSSSTFKYPL